MSAFVKAGTGVLAKKQTSFLSIFSDFRKKLNGRTCIVNDAMILKASGVTETLAPWLLVQLKVILLRSDAIYACWGNRAWSLEQNAQLPEALLLGKFDLSFC